MWIKSVLDTSRPVKRLITILYDATALPIAIYLALGLRHGRPQPPHTLIKILLQ